MLESNDPRVADLVQAGRLRVALFPPQYTKDSVTDPVGSGFVARPGTAWRERYWIVHPRSGDKRKTTLLTLAGRILLNGSRLQHLR